MFECVLFDKQDNRAQVKRMIGKENKRDKVSWQRKVHMNHRYYEKCYTRVKIRQEEKMLLRLDVLEE
jgi:hypothetical protein